MMGSGRSVESEFLCKSFIHISPFMAHYFTCLRFNVPLLANTQGLLNNLIQCQFGLAMFYERDSIQGFQYLKK
jgi:hypothetical protein